MWLISKIFLGLGLLSIFFSFLLIWERNNPNRLSFGNYKENTVKSSHISPNRIVIKDANIDLPIEPSKIEGNTWQTSRIGISYLKSSPLPGNQGNSILYGHNWISLLGSLHRVKPGQKIEIYYKNGVRKIFTISAIGVVTPDQTHVLSPSDDRRITLYTCTGFLDSKRLVVTAVADENSTNTMKLTDNINTL